MALMRSPGGGEPEEVTPAGANVRTRVHEYGGGAWSVAGDDLVLFVDFADQRLYRQRLGEEPVAITPEPASRGGPALRRLPARPRRRHASSACARSTARAKPRTRSSRSRSTATARRGCSPSGRDFYSFPRVSPDGHLARLDLLGPPEHALGRDRAVGGAARRPRPTRQLVAGGPASRSSSPSGTRRAGCTSSPTATAGGTSTAPGGGEIEQLTAEQAELGHPQWLFGGSTYAFLDGGSIVCVRCERGDRTARPARARRRRGARPRPPLHLLRLPLALGPRRQRRLRRRRAREREPEVVVLDVAGGETETCCGPPSERADRPRLRLGAAGDRVPDQRRRDRARLLLPADQPRVRGPGRRAAAADRRRATAARPPTRPPRSTASSSSGPAAASASSTSTTAAPAATGARYRDRLRGDLGHRRHRGLRRRRPLPGRDRRGRRRAAGDPRRLGRRLRDPLRARLPRRVRGRRELLRRRRRRDPGRRHPQVRVALPRRPDRALPGASRRSTASARRSTSSSACGPR